VIYEEFADGIMSAIDFTMELAALDDDDYAEARIL